MSQVINLNLNNKNKVEKLAWQKYVLGVKIPVGTSSSRVNLIEKYASLVKS